MLYTTVQTPNGITVVDLPKQEHNADSIHAQVEQARAATGIDDLIWPESWLLLALHASGEAPSSDDYWSATALKPNDYRPWSVHFAYGYVYKGGSSWVTGVRLLRRSQQAAICDLAIKRTG